MRNLVLFLIFLGITGYTVKILYEKFERSDESLLEKSYSYPDEIAIENQNGSKIQITLLGRNSNYLEFANKDGQKFVYPIRSLKEQSQALVTKYPNNGIKNISRYLSSGNLEMNDVYIIQLEDEIRKIKAEIERLEGKANATKSQVELRTIERKIDAMHEEITELESKIASWQ